MSSRTFGIAPTGSFPTPSSWEGERVVRSSPIQPKRLAGKNPSFSPTVFFVFSEFLALVVVSIVLLGLVLPVSGAALSGDVDGSGVVDMEDARTVARFVVSETPTLPNPAAADVTTCGAVAKHEFA